MGNSREAARQDAIRTLDRKYASYEIVDEDASDWVSGHAQVKDPDKFSMGGRDGHATTQEQVRTYKCSIRVKNAVPRKEGDTTTQSERKAQAAEAVIADAYKKESVKIEDALNTELGQQAKALGMICLIAYDKVGNQISVSKWKERVRKTTGLQELATKYDLRILDDPQPTEQENRDSPPVAYILFKTNDFSTGTKITGKMFADTVWPAILDGLKAELPAESYSEDAMSDFPSVPLYRPGKKSFETCDAVGMLVCPAWFPDFTGIYAGCQGSGVGIKDNRVYYIPIEVGSPLQKWIMTAKYHTNLFNTPTQ